MFTYTYICKNILRTSLPNIKHLIDIPSQFMFRLFHRIESMPNKCLIILLIILNGRMGWLIDIRNLFFHQLCYLHSFLAIYSSDVYELEFIWMINFKSYHRFWYSKIFLFMINNTVIHQVSSNLISSKSQGML